MGASLITSPLHCEKGFKFFGCLLAIILLGNIFQVIRKFRSTVIAPLAKRMMPWEEIGWFGQFISIKQDPSQTQKERRNHSGPCRLSKTEEGWDCRIPKPRLQISPHPGTFSDFTSQVGLKCPHKIDQLYVLTAVSTTTLFMSQLLKYCMVVKALQCSCMSGWQISLLSQ